jgi:hypothetical protein
MPEPLKDSADTPSLTEDLGVVAPDVTALKPSKAMAKYRPENKTLSKLLMEEANVGEVTTEDMEEKTAGVAPMLDALAFLSGYCFKEAEDKERGSGRVVPGTKGVQIGSAAARKDPAKFLDKIRASQGKKPAAKSRMWMAGGGAEEKLKSREKTLEELKD